MKEFNLNIFIGTLGTLLGIYYLIAGRYVNPIWTLATGLAFLRIEYLTRKR